MQAPMHILVVYFGGDRAKQQCVQCALLYESIHPQVRMSLRYIEKLDKRQLQQTLQQIKPDGLLLNGSTLPDTLGMRRHDVGLHEILRPAAHVGIVSPEGASRRHQSRNQHAGSTPQVRVTHFISLHLLSILLFCLPPFIHARALTPSGIPQSVCARDPWTGTLLRPTPRPTQLQC